MLYDIVSHNVVYMININPWQFYSTRNSLRNRSVRVLKGGAVMSTVLIVESYPNLANLYRDVLTEAGYNVLVASNSKEANDLSMSQAIDLAVIDEGLRGGDEKELIEKLRTNQPHIKAILCSLTEFTPKTYRDLCDEGFFKTHDYTVLLQKVADSSRKPSRRGRDSTDGTQVKQ